MKSEEVNLWAYNVAYNSFFSFIEHQKKSIESEFDTISYKKPSVTFFPILRHILDAKWNEILLLTDPRLFSRLSEFAFSWLCNFTVDSATRSVRKLSTDELQRWDEQVVKFFLDLSNPMLHKNWECLTLQEFLYDKCSSDELYFYLYARNLLFRGSQTNYTSSTFEAIHYVPLLQAEYAADVLLHQYEKNTKFNFKRHLRDNAVMKTSSVYIVDSGLTLRLLLEVYREERKNRFILLKDALTNSISSSSNVGFKMFRKVLLTNFPTVTDLEIATLFRESYSYGRSNDTGVNVETFFTAANESGFFIKHLKLLS